VPADVHASFEAVYRAHLPEVWRYVRARVPDDGGAQDVTSDAFLRALRSWERYDPGRGSVGAWLCGIARHAVADWWRGRRPEHLVGDLGSVAAFEAAASDAAGSDADAPEAVALRSEGADEVRHHLGRLTEREREVVALRFGAGLSSPEVGAVLGISPTAARMAVHRAVTKLREVITDA
jgi:RNA polymerase sigma factor (sigma-70 family)